MGRSIDPVDVANRLGAAMMRACEVLPAGWTLSVETERDAGSIRLSNPAGDDVEVSYDHDDLRTASTQPSTKRLPWMLGKHGSNRGHERLARGRQGLLGPPRRVHAVPVCWHKSHRDGALRGREGALAGVLRGW